MYFQISQKSKQAFEDACKQLNRSAAIPDFSMLTGDMGLYLTAVLMLATIIEAHKGGKVYDITDHSHKKYEPIFYADDGYEPSGSSAGGFSYYVYDYAGDRVDSIVGARLSSNSSEGCNFIAKEYLDLWQIFILN